MSATGKGGFGGPKIGGGPAPILEPGQPDIYTRVGGQQNVDSDPNLDGYQPPTSTPMQPPQAQQPYQPQLPGSQVLFGGGKGGFPQGPQIGGGPAPLDPNAPSPLGPEGQQSTMPQQNSAGGKGGFGVQPAFTQQQLQSFKDIMF